jgi:hypothetical protein
MGVVSNFIFTRRKGVEILWDKVYAGTNPIFLQSPSTVVMNVYLASQGWDVTGFDPSSEAIRLGRSNADKAGVRVRALVARDDEFQ